MPQIAICLTELDVGAIMRAKRAGANGFILKPFKPRPASRTLPHLSMAA